MPHGRRVFIKKYDLIFYVERGIEGARFETVAIFGRWEISNYHIKPIERHYAARLRTKTIKSNLINHVCSSPIVFLKLCTCMYIN